MITVDDVLRFHQRLYYSAGNDHADLTLDALDRVRLMQLLYNLASQLVKPGPEFDIELLLQEPGDYK